MELSPEAQALIDELANTALTRDAYTKGLALRAMSPLGKPKVTELLASLTPNFLHVDGAYPNDHYRIKTRGVLQSKHAESFLDVARQFRALIVDLFARDHDFERITWDDLVDHYKTLGREVPLTKEGARFVFGCVGAWAGGSDVRMRPLAEMLEPILDGQIGIGELLEIVDLHLNPPTPSTKLYTLPMGSPMQDKIFLIHGQNHTLRDKIQLYLAVDLGLKVQVMEAGANSGRTLPEKFEQMAAGCAFAVCILSGDDEVTIHGAEGDSRVRRARQNVVLELGHFWGLLGRECIAVLFERGVELPTDMAGLAWIEITDDLGKTKLDLHKELRAARIVP